LSAEIQEQGAQNPGLVAEREILGDPVSVGGSEDRGVSQGAAAFGIFGLEQMTPARTAEQDFAGGGYLETFGYGFSGLIASRSSHIGSLSWFSAGLGMHPGRLMVKFGRLSVR
jgi:hypothetical protein